MDGLTPVSAALDSAIPTNAGAMIRATTTNGMIFFISAYYLPEVSLGLKCGSSRGRAQPSARRVRGGHRAMPVLWGRGASATPASEDGRSGQDSSAAAGRSEERRVGKEGRARRGRCR